MKYLVAIVLLGLGAEAECQKYRLMGDTSRFLCKSDSIDHYFYEEMLKPQKIDTIISLHYYFDNGRYNTEIQGYIWKKNGKINLKAIQGCVEVIETGITEEKVMDFFDFYFRKNCQNLNHMLESRRSHEDGYSFSIRQNDFQKRGYISDPRRGMDFLEKMSRGKKKRKIRELEKNSLIKWINDIDRSLKKEIEAQMN